MRPNLSQMFIDSLRGAPVAWAGAVIVALLPVAVVTFKREAPAPTAPAAESTPVSARASSEPSSWFSGADNPFLTEEQARERRLRSAVSRVEDVIRRRPDVQDVTILAAPAVEGRVGGISAVVTIQMRQGVVPIALVDATGTLLSAAVPGLRTQDVTVIDERSGIRASAAGMDEQQAVEGRKALAAAQAAPERPAAVAPPQQAPVPVAAAAHQGMPWNTIGWIGGFAVACLLALMVYRLRMPSEEPDVTAVTTDDPIAGTLSMAFHRSVAEQSALIATALVERLEQRGASANEVAQLLLSLEPWAAERLLKSMPPDALAKVEEALRDPAAEAPTRSIRALAEAVLSVRAAA